MRTLRHLWLAIMLLSLGLGPWALQSLKQSACCCTSRVPTASCHCQDQPDSHCGLECAPEPQQAVLQAAVDPPQPRLVAFDVIVKILILLHSYEEPPDGRLCLAAGWMLPSSPPIRTNLLDLPPPFSC